MTLYRNTSHLQDNKPLEFPEAPDRYQLYLIDDDESEHAPDLDMGPRSADEPIGEFSAMAFMINKKFKKQEASGADAQIQTEEERQALAA